MKIARWTALCGLSALLFVATASDSFAQQRTVIRDQKAAKMLLGSHLMSLQWISWDQHGRAKVTARGGVYYLTGEQKGIGNSNLLTVDGRITEITAKEFKFDGTIITKIDHINGGQPCERKGEMTFRVTGKRKYWRLMEMNNPCDEAADYVDIYFR
jgi:hypothetical protein